MVLDVTVAASAARLQTQLDQAALLRAETRRQEQAAATSLQQRLVEERERTDRIGEDLNNARLNREFVRDVTDNIQINDAEFRAVDDRRIEERIAREQDDIESDVNERLFERAQLEAADSNPLTDTAPAAPAETLSQLISERDARNVDRAARDREFDIQQERNFERSQQLAEQAQTDPSIIPSEPERGSLVDFSA